MRGTAYGKIALATSPAGVLSLLNKWSFDRREWVGSVHVSMVHGSYRCAAEESTTALEPIFNSREA